MESTDFSCASLLSVAPLASPRGSAASWHVGGLIPAEQRPRRRKVADFKQAEFEFGKFRLGPGWRLPGGLSDLARLSGACGRFGLARRHRSAFPNKHRS